MAGWEPKKLRPTHLRIVLLHWQGYSNDEVAALVSRTPQCVSNILQTEAAANVLGELQKRSLDTIMETEVAFQAAAPLAQEKLIGLLDSEDEKVVFQSAKEILNMSGHQPVKRVSIEREAPKDKYEGLTEEELRRAILAAVEGEAVATPPSGPTVH